jgi:hypothetical protein
MKNIQLTFSGNVLTGSVVLPEKKVLPYLRKIKSSLKNNQEFTVSIRTIANEGIYVNRYNDKIKFTEFADKPGVIEMTGFFEEGLRIGFKDNPSNITMVDPSGGPFLTIGSNMELFPSLKGIISGFVIEQGKVFIHLKK